MNTGKQINAMVVVLFLLLVAVGAYTMWDPFRSDAAKTEQDEKAATFGAQTFTLNCRLCHGDRGEGGQAGGRLAAALALDRPDLQGIDSDGTFNQALLDANVRLVSNTIMCGRAGTLMPTWGASQGSILSDEQIRQLVVLISEGDWELAQEHADETDAMATNHATVRMPTGSLSADGTELIVSDAGSFTLGQYVRIDTERLRVLPKSLEVERGVDGTQEAEHTRGAVLVKADGQPSEDALAEKTDDQATVLAVHDTEGFSVGDTLQLDDEKIRVVRVLQGIPTTDQVLAKGIGRTPKTILVSGPQGIEVGTVIRIDSELMEVAGVRDDGRTGATLDAAAGATDAQVSFSNPTFFRQDYQIRVGDEVLRVVGAVDVGQTLFDGIGTAQTKLSVSGTKGIEQGMIIRLDDELFRVKEIVRPAQIEIQRGVDGTQAASHTPGIAVLKVVAAPAEGQQPEDPTTGQTLAGAITADDTIAPVGGTSKLAVGQKYTLDGETVQITNVEPAVLKVERAVGGTKKAPHARRATVYNGNLVQVERGVNGSTPAAHDAGEPVHMTALRVKRGAQGSKLAEHGKNTELFLGNRLIVARGLLGTTAADHTNGALVRNFPAAPEDPTLNAGPTCGQRAPAGAGTPAGPTSTPIAEATTVKVSLTEFKVTTDVPSVAAGAVQFEVTNEGVAVHNFRIIKTDLAPDKLPVANSAADEAQLDVVGGISTAIQPGSTESVGVSQLASGSYVLICNVPTHYQSGMHAAFTVP